MAFGIRKFAAQWHCLLPLAYALAALVLPPPALADDANGVEANQALSSMQYDGGTDSLAAEFSPNWSHAFGWSMQGAAGTQIGDGLALALIVEYGTNQREFLVNTGLQLTDSTSLVGSAGQLQQDVDFGSGNGRDEVRQMEYALGLQSEFDMRLLSQLELGGYFANASADSGDVMAGEISGFQFKSTSDITDSLRVTLGAGYEWLSWEDGSTSKGVTQKLEARQFLTDNLSLFGSGSIAGSENSYAAGLNYDIGAASGTQRLGLVYTRIHGHDGIQSDDRIQAIWSMGFGPIATAASLEAERAEARRNSRLLKKIMKRYNILPKMALAKSRPEAVASPTCGNGILETGEACDDGNLVDGDSCSSACALASCGNGVLETGEACDDGNLTDGDSCSSTCALATCGNGIQETGEACDDGNASNTDSCLNTCLTATCGDGNVETGVEACDDGNSDNSDSCTNACAAATCGDGLIQSGEDCDDGNATDTDSCLNSCVSASCGDGYVEAGIEQCDDGNSDNTDDCLNTCVSAICGDGYVEVAIEQCDDGNSTSGDGCSAICQQESVCGNSIVETGEDCDDGNSDEFDACTSSCMWTG